MEDDGTFPIVCDLVFTNGLVVEKVTVREVVHASDGKPLLVVVVGAVYSWAHIIGMENISQTDEHPPGNTKPSWLHMDSVGF